LGTNILIEFRDEKTAEEMLAWETFAEVPLLRRHLLLPLVLPPQLQWILLLRASPDGGLLTLLR
jgi:hypothetical protein